MRCSFCQIHASETNICGECFCVKSTENYTICWQPHIVCENDERFLCMVWCSQVLCNEQLPCQNFLTRFSSIILWQHHHAIKPSIPVLSCEKHLWIVSIVKLDCVWFGHYLDWIVLNWNWILNTYVEKAEQISSSFQSLQHAIQYTRFDSITSLKDTTVFQLNAQLLCVCVTRIPARSWHKLSAFDFINIGILFLCIKRKRHWLTCNENFLSLLCFPFFSLCQLELVWLKA